jgi:uncharacterized integral membrane protein
MIIISQFIIYLLLLVFALKKETNIKIKEKKIYNP